MKSYQFQILRYKPDPVSGEFVNVGLILFHPNEKYLKGRVVESITRLSSFFPETDGRNLAKTLHFIEGEIQRIAEELQKELYLKKYEDVESITKSILPKDDSALQFTDMKEGIDVELDSAFEDLFERLVNMHLDKPREDEVKTDYDVWRKVYKNYFDKYGITKYLTSHSVKTKNDQLNFDYAWKNGDWNCYQSISFNLKRKDSIKNKVYKWDGILNELATTKEVLEVYLLTYLPKHHQNGLKEFIKRKLDEKEVGTARVRLVTENEIDDFIIEIKRDLEKHLEEEER